MTASYNPPTFVGPLWRAAQRIVQVRALELTLANAAEPRRLGEFHPTYVEDVLADSVRRLRSAHRGEPTPRLICKRPACAEPVERTGGRPALFCSASCQSTYQRERDEVRRQLRELHRLAAQYEVRLDGSSAVPQSDVGPRDSGRRAIRNPGASVGGADQAQQILVELLHSIQLALIEPPTGTATPIWDELVAARDLAYARLAALSRHGESSPQSDV
ncbi:hypothetical protein [Nocardioides sp.]|uniref:hypothetical protein n=1 Tax=Nocardioides sp. TaxID=35761 RepID=UPI0035B07736